MARARKVALAYRARAEEHAAQARELRDLLAEINPTLLKFADTELAGRIQKAIKTTVEDVADLDQRFWDWGESWHCPSKQTYEPDDMLPAREAAPLIQVAANTLNRMRLRGRIKGHWKGGKGTGVNGQYLYRVRDVYQLSSELRGRGWRATDSVPDQEEARSNAD